LDHASDIDRIRAENKHDDSSRLVYYKDGLSHVAVFDHDPGKTFEVATNSENLYQSLSMITRVGGLIQAPMELFTVYTANFWFRNAQRGLRTSMGRLGTRRTLRALFSKEVQNKGLKMAWNYAMAAHGVPMLPEVKALVERNVLMPPRLSRIRAYDAANQRALMEGGLLMAYDIGRPSAKSTWWERSKRKVKLDKLANVAAAYEAYEKIMNLAVAEGRGDLSPRAAAAAARRSGIPKPGVGGRSKWLNLLMETFFTWSRVSIQGELSNYDTLRDPDLGKGYAGRFALYELLPRLMMFALGSGAVAMLSGRDDDDDEPLGVHGAWAEAVRRASPYKMALDTTIPISFYDPRTGEYHSFAEAGKLSKVPDHWEAFSLRIPSSEEGRVWGPLAYNLMANNTETLGKPGRGTVGTIGNWSTSTLFPGLNPILENAHQEYQMIVEGKNPEDPFTGGKVANPLLFDAGWGNGRGEAVLGSALQQLGGPGTTIGQGLVLSGAMDERAIKSSSRRTSSDKTPLMERLPLLKGMVSYDNGSEIREERKEEMRSDEARAKAKAFLPLEVKQMYDFYYRNRKRKNDLDRHDRIRYYAAESFVNGIWGKAVNAEKDTLYKDRTYREDNGQVITTPATLYGKVIWAMDKDASTMAKDSLKEEILRSADPYLKMYNNPTAVLKAYGVPTDGDE
jgi:hypothetical protein